MLFSLSGYSAAPKNRKLNQGFTLVEVLVVIVIIGILAAIAISSWQRFIANQRVAQARDEIRQGILQAQTSAMRMGEAWRFSIREADGRIEWAIHANTIDVTEVPTWNVLDPTVVLDSADTTLPTKAGAHYVRFGFKGDVEYRLGTITLDSKDGIARNRCVIISTLIGATREGEAQAFPNGNGRYCY